jgi:hypothetical protein
MKVRSKLIPRIHGQLLWWVDENQFVMIRRGVKILGHKDYWSIEE